MKFELLNHASFKLSFRTSETTILFDPWYVGSCFEEGWGLKYDNPDALDSVRGCTHLWISHFHTDHFHVPTLKKILEINPDIQVLGNHSFNFQMDEVLKRVGFQNLVSFGEREYMDLSPNLRVIRYPTTGIDSMLLIRSDEGTVLNYNDCNIPGRARRKLAAKIGPIDVLLNNYNHAGKILDYPLPSTDEIQRDLKENFKQTVETFAPKYTIPFASFHYYKAPESQDLNDSLYAAEELRALDANAVPIKIGQSIEFSDDCTQYAVSTESERVVPNEIELRTPKDATSIKQLTEASRIFCGKVNRGFLFLTFWVPKLYIRVTDLDEVVCLSVFRGEIRPVDRPHLHHISATSHSLFTWWSKVYGTDSFVVGAHFEINDEHTFPMRFKFLLALLTENRLDLASLLKMVVSAKGLRFLFNRREEIASILLTRGFNVGTRQ